MIGFYRGLHKKILTCSVTSTGVFVGVPTDIRHRLRQARYDNMTIPIVYVLQTYLLGLMVSGSGTNDAKQLITCHAGTFASGGPAAITCNFHTDLRVTKLGVNVVRYQRHTAHGHPGTNILVCTWENNNTKCNAAKSGYTFNGTNQDPFEIMIPAVSDEFAGLYKCFLVPPGETDPQACELIVKELPESSSSSPEPQTPDKTDENKLVVGIVVICVVAVISWIVLGIFVFKRRSKRREEAVMWDGHLGEEEGVALMPSPEEPSQETKPCLNQKIEELVSRFRLSTDDLKGIMDVISREMEAGLKKKEGAKMKICHTYLRSMPSGQENGDYLVVTLGSTSLKIRLIKLGGGNFKIESNNYKIKSEIRLGARIQLFQFLADSVKAFLSEHNLTEQRLPFAFIFSFPFEYETNTDLTKAKLLKWTKDFDCRGVVGKEVGRLLQEALERDMTTKRLEMRAVLNDDVCLLVSLAHKDPKCMIGLMFGHGFNACYIQEETQEVADDDAKQHACTVITTTEWGEIGETGCLDPFRTEFDRDLDALSVNRKEQILEKMVSRAHIGEIARLVLVKLIKSGLLFTSNEAECHALKKKGGFITDYVALIESDKDAGHFNTKIVLQQLGMDNYTDADCSIVFYVCGIISERSAHLAAAALAALINHLNKPDVTIAVDGSLYRSHPRFQALLSAKTKQLINEGLDFTIKPSLNGSGKGAALIAAVSPSQENTK